MKEISEFIHHHLKYLSSLSRYFGFNKKYNPLLIYLDILNISFFSDLSLGLNNSFEN